MSTLNLRDLYVKYRGYTMLSWDQFCDNMKLAEQGVKVNGSIVECGTWKGGALAAMAEMYGSGRSIVGFDSFEGLPAAGEKDGDEARAYQQDTDSPRYFDNCKASYETFQEALSLADRPYLVFRGWFEDTVPGYATTKNPISILRLDGDWYDSTMVCLKYLEPLVSPGGVIIIDDYYHWEGCRRAVHDYLSETNDSIALHSSKHNVCYIIKD